MRARAHTCAPTRTLTRAHTRADANARTRPHTRARARPLRQLLFLVYYIFGIVAVLLFKGNDPFNFATLPLAILTLFRVRPTGSPAAARRAAAALRCAV